MEVLEFMRQKKRMCDYYRGDTCVCGDSRGTCPAFTIDCSFTTDTPEQLVAIVEQWAKEHPVKPEQNAKNYAKMIQDDLNGAIYRSLILNKERIENLDDNLVTLQHNMAGLETKIAALANAMDEIKGDKNGTHRTVCNRH